MYRVGGQGENMSVTFDEIVSLMKRRGFVYPGSDIYGGLANTYDYGPMGTQLLRNIRNAWWDFFVTHRLDMVGLEASLISHHRIWDASGHTTGFSDALIDCKVCKNRMRADHLIEAYLDSIAAPQQQKYVESLRSDDPQSLERMKKAIVSKKAEGLTVEEFNTLIVLFEEEDQLPCPNCKKSDWTQARKFNLLFPVQLGIVEGEQSLAYLRGETAQGMFINFKNVLDSTRVKLPFGIAQLGKSFRNEITLGNSVFRTIEFDQGEIEYFFDPDTTNWEVIYAEWKQAMWTFATKILGLSEDNLRWRIHSDEERSFYSKRTEDLEYNFPWGGFKELWGLAYRSDYDLKQHMKFSGKDLSVLDSATGKRFVPHVIEPAVGINRLFLAVICDGYRKDEERNRTVLELSPKLAPYIAAVFPLVANKQPLVDKAREVHAMLATVWPIAWDDRGNIGKRYLSQDEVGTPFAITIDFTTLEDGTVTIRERKTAQQHRVAIEELKRYIANALM